jgi:hypothetical protein
MERPCYSLAFLCLYFFHFVFSVHCFTTANKFTACTIQVLMCCLFVLQPFGAELNCTYRSRKDELPSLPWQLRVGLKAATDSPYILRKMLNYDVQIWILSKNGPTAVLNYSLVWLTAI